MYKTLLLITGIVTAIFSAIIFFEIGYNIYNYLNLKFLVTNISIITDLVHFIAATLFAICSFGFIKQKMVTKNILLFATILLTVFYSILIIYLKNIVSIEYINVKSYFFRVSYSAFLTFIAWNFIIKLSDEKL
ncbi:MAG: hypothetical protein HUU47_06815 [Bacteroidetes bacterium]|nr:hypothetical protein [Bacteroidota bacterium]